MPTAIYGSISRKVISLSLIHICEELGENPKNCIAIEDSKNGILSAKNADMNVIMIPDLWQGDNDTDTVSYTHLKITKYLGTATSVAVPAKINGYAVKAVELNANRELAKRITAVSYTHLSFSLVYW